MADDLEGATSENTLRLTMGDLEIPIPARVKLDRETVLRVNDLLGHLNQFSGFNSLRADIQAKIKSDGDKEWAEYFGNKALDKVWFIIYSALRLHEYVYGTGTALPHEKYNGLGLPVLSYELERHQYPYDTVSIKKFGDLGWAIMKNGDYLSKTPYKGYYRFFIRSKDDDNFSDYLFSTPEEAVSFWKDNRQSILATCQELNDYEKAEKEKEMAALLETIVDDGTGFGYMYKGHITSEELEKLIRKTQDDGFSISGKRVEHSTVRYVPNGDKESGLGTRIVSSKPGRGAFEATIVWEQE